MVGRRGIDMVVGSEVKAFVSANGYVVLVRCLDLLVSKSSTTVGVHSGMG